MGMVEAMRYIVLDLETTGLNKQACIPVELGILVLDERAQILGEYTGAIDVRNEVPHTADGAQVFEERAIKLHQKTGLMQEIAEGKCKPREQVESEAIDVMTQHGCVTPGDHHPYGEAIMIGNNPTFDRPFVERCFPRINAMLHYRMIDVSTLRQLASLVTGMSGDRLKAALRSEDSIHGMPHRALLDCKHCYKELAFYAKHFNTASLMAELQAMGAI